MNRAETANDLVSRLRALTVEDANDILEDAVLSNPLKAEDVLALYNSILDRVIGQDG